ncbi:hypothetical protein ACFX1S_023652 [Malus domestica]
MDGEREPEVWSSWLIVLAGRWIWTALVALLGRHGKDPGRASGPVSLPMVAARDAVKSALNSVGAAPPLSTESLGDEVEVERSNDCTDVRRLCGIPLGDDVADDDAVDAVGFVCERRGGS